MKKLITKTLLIALLCSAGMPSHMQAGLRNKATGALACCALGAFAAYKLIGSLKLFKEGNLNDLYTYVSDKCRDPELIVTEENAQEIFKSEGAKIHIPRAKIEFMEKFMTLCGSIKDIGGEDVENSTKTYLMAANYLRYLNYLNKKSYISKKLIVGICLGAGGTALVFSKVKNSNPLIIGTAMIGTAVITHMYGNKIINGFKQLGNKVINGFKQLENKFKKKGDRGIIQEDQENHQGV